MTERKGEKPNAKTYTLTSKNQVPIGAIGDTWETVKILDEMDLIGLNQHPFPEAGIAIGKTLDEVIAHM